MWKEETAGRSCFGYDIWGDSVEDQKSCQKQCQLDGKCIGISYSQDPVFKDWCLICHDDILTAAPGFGFGFYRKPGNILTLDDQ